MKTLLVIVLFAVAVLLSAHVSASAQDRGMTRCTVADPTGTLLNVRSSPNGKRIVSKLKNGASVFLDKYGDYAQGREWALVRSTGKKVNKPLGWVLSEFLECGAAD